MTRYEAIMSRVQEHYNDALKRIPEERIFGIFLEGSQNYNMDMENSDIDTKLFIFPSLDDIIYNKTPISTTWIRDNNEHISVKDIRLVMTTFRKQNLNFLEVLFTPYFILNPRYSFLWNVLVTNREKIARYNQHAAVMAMYGVAYNKFKMLFKISEATEKSIEKFGYAPKQLHHLKRIEYFLEKYIEGNDYMSCMRPPQDVTAELIAIKQGKYNKDIAKRMAEESIKHIKEIRKYVIDNAEIYNKSDTEVNLNLMAIQKKLMMTYLKSEVLITE